MNDFVNKRITIPLNLKKHFSNPTGAVLLTIVIIIIIIGITGVAIYTITSTSSFTQLYAQNATRAFFLAESGFRVVASEYNNASGNKNSILENLHGTTLNLPDNAGQFDVRLYPYWFYVNSTYTANDTSISVKMPGGIPLRDPEDPTSSQITIPGSGKLKLRGKTQLATFTGSSVGGGDIITFYLNPGFPYDIQSDEDLFLVLTDNSTQSQSISQNGNLVLPGSNPAAQILPRKNGSFRVYNENNDKMDYTFTERLPAVIDPGNPPASITLNGIDHQNDADPSVFPLPIDNTTEMYLGKNLAVFSTSTFGQGSMAATKTVGEYTDAGADGGFSTGKDTISFEEDIADFEPTMNDPGGPSDPNPIEINIPEKNIELGGGLAGGYGSVWYKGDTDIASCIEGKCLFGKGIRAFFEFEFDDTDTESESKAYGDGFTFSFISGVNYTDGDTGEGGEYLGYAGKGSSSNGLQPPKIGVEIDTYPNPGAGNVCGSNSRRDDTPVANHAAVVYWGEEVLGSFEARSTSNYIADGGGFLLIGSSSPSDGDPEDWSSTQGTISFWFKRDTIRYAPNSASGDRMWGQNANMEMRFSGGDPSPPGDFALDWGGDSSLTIINHPFTDAGKWYFLAITWNESTHTLRVYYGDENNTPTIIQESPSDPLDPEYWDQTVSSRGITQNLFMNSSGGNGNRNYIVDGKGADLRYYNTERTLIEIQGDYNTRLSGNESNLQAYFPLQTDLIDVGPSGITATAMGTTGWSSDQVQIAPDYYLDCGTASATYDDNRHGSGGTTTPLNSLNTNSGNGDDGYHQVTGSSPNWLEDGSPHLFRIELIRPLEDDPLGSGNYKYQMKIWIDCDPCSGDDIDNFKNVRWDFSATAPLITKTILNSNPLVLNTTDHEELKRILFGFTEGTGGATQNITLRDFELYFLKNHPTDLNNW